MSPLEIVRDGATPLAYIVDPAWVPEMTTFLTPDDFGQQIGMIVYKAGEAIPAHVHLPVKREVHGTTECIIVRKGKCEIDIFNGARKFIATRVLQEGSIVLLIEGGHGFRMQEDTILFEVKQGPYVGGRDKERF
jgi:hypothetical protein